MLTKGAVHRFAAAIGGTARRAGDPYSLTHEQVSATSENYAFFDTLVEVERLDEEPAPM